jgi:hypothetical protein
VPNNAFAFGWRQYDKTLRMLGNEKITAMGIEIFTDYYSYSQKPLSMLGNMYSTVFRNVTKYSFVPYAVVQGGDFRHIQIDNLQVQAIQTAVNTGYHWVHLVGEPLRSFINETNFQVSEFFAGDACMYATTGADHYLDAPASASIRPFTSFSGFVPPYVAKVIDKEANTSYDTNLTTSGTSDSGFFDFYFRMNFTVLDYKGNPIPNATITVKNNAGTVEINDTTDANGNALKNGDTGSTTSNRVRSRRRQKIYPQTTTQYTETLYGPFTVTITASGYKSYTSVMAVDVRKDLTIKMASVLSNNQHQSVLLAE